ncbi:MAG: 4'-phosphopantetheinyl transferase superfamily protein [Polyangiaceae bacterium]|nr:4'-phosphopantetheinyl transferase superfamily protein [Polyangiaceae bacterium]
MRPTEPPGAPAGLVWHAARAAEVPAGDGWLGPRERALQAALRSEPRRAAWRLGRYAAKGALARHLGLAAGGPAAEGAVLARLEVLAAPDGAPELHDAHREHGLGLALTLSHRAGHAVAAVAPGPVGLGCDLELVEPRSAAFVAYFLTVAEQALVARAPRPELLANLVWSATEAALKALRTGLRRDSRSVEIEVAEAALAAVGARAPAWHPLRARDVEAGVTLAGAWRVAGDLVWTCVWAPVGAAPHGTAPAPGRGMLPP